MFGKGVYLADMFSKAYGYASGGRFGGLGGFGRRDQEESSLLLLCEAALGKSKKLWRPDAELKKPPPPCQSVHGVGRMTPDYNDSLMMPSGVEVPTGAVMESKDTEPVDLNNNAN